MKKFTTLLILALITVVLTSGCVQEEEKLKISTDKESYMTSDHIIVRAENTLNLTIYHEEGCSALKILLYEKEANGSYTMVWPRIICLAMPSIQELEPGELTTENITAEDVGPGVYRPCFRYSLTKGSEHSLGYPRVEDCSEDFSVG